NASPTIRLRGISTFGQNSQPLVVIDGVIGATLDNVDPNDIETINVLKDGSAAAIYGTRGSSGVILVTTKKGKAGALSVDYNGYVSSASIFKALPIMTPEEYVAAGGNDLGSRTEWQKEVTRTAISNVHNIGISGGTQNTQFRMSTNFRNQQGILKTTGWDQINTRAGMSHTALDGKLKFDFNMSFTNRNSDLSFPEAFRYATLYNPTAPVRFDNGDYYQAILFDNYNPVAIIEQNHREALKKTLNYGGKIDYQIFKDLTWTVNYGRQNEDYEENAYYSSKSLWTGYGRNGFAKRWNNNRDFTLFETYGTYTKQAGKLDIVANAGYSYTEDQYAELRVEMGNFPSDQLGYNNMEDAGDRISGIATNVDVRSDKTPRNKIVAGFARLNLTWDNGLFFNASVRQEGSTKFSKNNKWGTFPAIGAGIDINKYMQLPNVSLLKFRVGYGVTGAVPADAGISLDTYEYDFAGGGAVSIENKGNDDLHWEKKKELNAGLEFGVGRLTGTLDVYTRTIEDLIFKRSVRPEEFGGARTRYENIATLQTPGVELNINYNDIQLGAVRWTTGLVASHYVTKMKEYFPTDKKAFTTADFGAPGQNGTFPLIVEKGQPIGQIWGPVFAGVNESNGTPVFADLNGDGKVVSAPSNALADDADMKVLGKGIPSVELGWTNRLSIGNWDMNVFFRSALGHSLINQFRAFYEPIDPGAINSYNRISTSKAVPGLTSAQYSSLYVERADFVRLDNMTIGYTIKVANKNLKNIRLYLSGQNIFQITKYTGIDPEPSLLDVEQDPDDPLSPGIDRRNNYYTSRTFTFGINLGLQ
ncbi:MAG TPA: SusC/RagA family TonB-linked outer membrane protein, partial [Cyclobacteriaceae bacterium]|nr:SusC/RagA family TonB-linked outer membrane protein [Cyclobacteriaceae bacterium]